MSTISDSPRVTFFGSQGGVSTELTRDDAAETRARAGFQKIYSDSALVDFLKKTPGFEELKPNEAIFSIEREKSKTGYRLWIVVRSGNQRVKIPQSYKKLYEIAHQILSVPQTSPRLQPSPSRSPSATPPTSNSPTPRPASRTASPVKAARAQSPQKCTQPPLPQLSQTTRVETIVEPAPTAISSPGHSQEELLDALRQERETLKTVLERQEEQFETFQEQLQLVQQSCQTQIDALKESSQSEIVTLYVRLDQRLQEQHNLINQYREELIRNAAFTSQQIDAALRQQHDKVEWVMSDSYATKQLILNQQQRILDELSALIDENRLELLQHVDALIGQQV